MLNNVHGNVRKKRFIVSNFVELTYQLEKKELQDFQLV